MNKIIKGTFVILSTLIPLVGSSVSVLAENFVSNSTKYVTDDMCSSSYWIEKLDEPNKILLTKDEIIELNNKILNTKDTYMNDLEHLDETFNGNTYANQLSAFSSPKGLYLNGEAVDESYYEEIRQNIADANVSESMNIKYGICTNRTVMKAYPYSDFLSDSANDLDWDELVSTEVYVNEPVVLYFLTADSEFAYVKSECCSGWVPYEDIAICSSKEEWLDIKNTKDILVVTGEKVYLEYTNNQPESSGKMLTMGTVLPLDLQYKNNDSIGNRIGWNSYAVKIPCRNTDGSFYQVTSFIPYNRDVNIGYLDMTTSNIIELAFKSLGNRYGWGGMLNSNDCSGYVKQIYKCFGLNIARNTTWQGAMPVNVVNIGDLDDKNKEYVFNNLLPGAILQFRGHEMLYIGSEEGRYYVISNVGSLVESGDETYTVLSPNSIIINDLSVMRRNKNTWQSELDKVIIVWE